MLLDSYQHLIFLNTTPVRIRCRVPEDIQCYPLVKLSSLSSCERLIHSTPVRYLLWCSASITLPLLGGAIAWFIYQIRVTVSDKNLYHILSLIQFLSNTYVCAYLYAIAAADYISQGYYAVFEATWRRSIPCILLNSLSYSVFQTGQFLCFLISCTRAAAVLLPFKAVDMSKLGIFIAFAVWFILSLILGYAGLTRPISGYVNLLQSALGLGLLLPATKGYTPWYMLLFIVPNGSVLLSICVCRATLLKGLLWVPEAVASLAASRAFRRRATHTCIMTLLVGLTQYSSLLILHTSAIFQLPIGTSVPFLLVIVTLCYISITNVMVYFIGSSDFRGFVIRRLF